MSAWCLMQVEGQGIGAGRGTLASKGRCQRIWRSFAKAELASTTCSSDNSMISLTLLAVVSLAPWAVNGAHLKAFDSECPATVSATRGLIVVIVVVHHHPRHHHRRYEHHSALVTTTIEQQHSEIICCVE